MKILSKTTLNKIYWFFGINISIILLFVLVWVQINHMGNIVTFQKYINDLWEIVKITIIIFILAIIFKKVFMRK